MYHYVNAVTNTKGDALIGYYVKAVDAVTGSTASLYADASSTPIISVSDVADAAKVDSDGNASFFIAGGEYHLDIYATDSTTFVRRISNVPMVDFTVAAGNVASRTLLAAKNAANGDVWSLSESGREGAFVFSSTNLSTQVTNDPAQAIYVPPSSDTTGASGAFIRKFSGDLNAKWFGVMGDGSTDDTTAAQRALTYANYVGGANVFFPGATYIVTALTVAGNVRIKTDGFLTKFKQKSGTAANSRIISITGSNVRIDDLQLEGQLNQAGDTTGEQNHGIFIYIGAADTASRSNISIGNVKGTNIRGDVVLIGLHPTPYAAGYRLSQISVEQVIGSNVYRNGVSVAGGEGVSVASITGTQIGYKVLDLEPDVGSGPVIGFRAGYVKGRFAGVSGAASADYIDGAEIGELDLDPSYTTGSSPAYSSTPTDGLAVRNTKSLRIGKFKANGFQGAAIAAVAGSLSRQVVTIDQAEVTDCLKSGATAGYFAGDAGIEYHIGALAATTTAAANSVFYQCVGALVGVAIVSMFTGSAYMSACTTGKTGLLNISTNGGGNGCNVILSSTNCEIRAGTVTGDTLLAYSSGCLVENVTATMATGYVIGTVANHTIRKSTLGGTYAELRQYIAATTASVTIDASGNLTATAGTFNNTVTSQGSNAGVQVSARSSGNNFLLYADSGTLNLYSNGAPRITFTDTGNLAATGSITSSSATAGVGYATGAGGTVTQATSKSTGVTLNKATGQITMSNAALAAGTIVSFVLTNSAIAATDILVLNHVSGGTPGSYTLNARAASGSATIDVRNNTAGSLSEAIVIGYAVVKAVTS